VSGHVYGGVGRLNDFGPDTEQLVHDPVDGALVARDDPGAEDDLVARPRLLRRDPDAGGDHPETGRALIGLSICRVIAVERIRPDFPKFDIATSIASKARSDGVVHRPAAANSG